MHTQLPHSEPHTCGQSIVVLTRALHSHSRDLERPALHCTDSTIHNVQSQRGGPHNTAKDSSHATRTFGSSRHRPFPEQLSTAQRSASRLTLCAIGPVTASTCAQYCVLLSFASAMSPAGIPQITTPLAPAAYGETKLARKSSCGKIGGPAALQTSEANGYTGGGRALPG